MLNTALTLVHGAALLGFGVAVSVGFSGVSLTRKNNVLPNLAVFFLCGALQALVFAVCSETAVWKLYPVITHLPLVVFLMAVYRRRLVTALAAVFTAYLCCQPAKWFGVLAFSLSESVIVEYAVRFCVLAVAMWAALRYFAADISELFGKDTRSVCLFGSVPAVYYAYDYAVGVYADDRLWSSVAVAEFLPMLLCVVFMAFCVVYYKEYERRADAQRKEQIVGITMTQQAKEMKAVRRGEQELRILRHDMRLFLNNLSLCLENGDVYEARKMIAGYAENVEATAVQRYCKNAMVNCILSDYAAKCAEAQVEFLPTVTISELTADEIMFSSVLANALDNALNAQKELPPAGRRIHVMLKDHGGKLLLSVRNPFAKKPLFADGLPVTGKKGHGYGTQSIRYMTERMGGNCQFTTEGNVFVLRVVI